MKKTKEKTIVFRMQKSMLNHIERQSKKLRMNRSEFVRMAVETYIENYSDK